MIVKVKLLPAKKLHVENKIIEKIYLRNLLNSKKSKFARVHNFEGVMMKI